VLRNKYPRFENVQTSIQIVSMLPKTGSDSLAAFNTCFFFSSFDLFFHQKKLSVFFKMKIVYFALDKTFFD